MASDGALSLDVPALYLRAHGYRVPLLPLLDVAALFAPPAQAIGRVGAIVNGAFVGYPGALPWATASVNPGAVARPLCRVPYTRCVAFQPAMAHDLLFSLGLFALLWVPRHRAWLRGMRFALSLALYSAGGLVLVIWRASALVWGPLERARVTVIVVLILLPPIAWALCRSGRTARSARPDGVVAGLAARGAP
jgi:prolipoprotein diacylglyceryltransferase